MPKLYSLASKRWLLIILLGVNLALGSTGCNQGVQGEISPTLPLAASPSAPGQIINTKAPPTQGIPKTNPIQTPKAVPTLGATQVQAASPTVSSTLEPTSTTNSPTPVGLVISPQNAANLQMMGEVPGGQVIDFAWLAGGQDLAIATEADLIAYRLSPGTEINQIQVFTPTQVIASPTQSLVAWTSQDQTLHLWQATQGGVAKTLPAQKEDITSLAFSPDGGTLASSTYTNQITLFSTLTGQISATWELPYWLSNLAYSSDGSQLAGVDQSNFTAYILDAHSGKELRSLAWTDSASPVLYGAFFSPDWRTIAWVARGSVQLMDAENGELGANLSHEDVVNAFSWSPDGRLIAVSTAATVEGNFVPVIMVWDTVSAQVLKTVPLEEPATRLSFSPDGRSLAALNSGGKIQVWGLTP